ncbi:hypothetical protein RSOL_209210 [Rhizoctonia solani AG-3 Rhs1AP]|uniref:Uncharacterized protein n=2 Tax=Rhizoctonia solani AG-3 TaxID=1086053 RepID=A0A074SHW5_9AGAM|nr:hypothetical protein RSOL_209210 [Rhizoctonia solani AG-3 Rhs1AP]KEP49602.1 hypothetical protein V565_097170 [Rhizoctonia solani 123E]
MSGKMPEIIPLPHPKPVSPPNSAQGIAEPSHYIDSPPFALVNLAHSPLPSLSPAVQGVNELGGHPPPPPPHSPPPPIPKSARVQECGLIPNAEVPKPQHPPPPPPHSPPPPNPRSARVYECNLTPIVEPGYPPPPPPHSPPPPPEPKSKNEHYSAMTTMLMSPAGLLVALIDAYICDARIYPTKVVLHGGHTPKPPRPHPDPISPPPPPPRVDLSKAFGPLTSMGHLCSNTVKFGTDLLPQGGHCGGLVVGCI